MTTAFILWQIGFIYAAIKKRNDIADVLWGFSIVVAVALSAIGRKLGLVEFILLASTAAWGLRLSAHIGARFLAHDEEDSRYAKMRKDWKKTWLWRSWLQVFLLQPLLAVIIALPVIFAVRIAPSDFTTLTAIGLIVWIIGFVFEVIGDRQLRAFKANPENRDKIMTTGLWNYSRHPNYFGEVTLWWGLFIMSVHGDSWWLVTSPVLITYLILKVSGVPMLEKAMENRPGFEEYKRRTSIFFPLPKKS